MNNVITASLNHSNESIARALAFSAARGDDGIIYCSSTGINPDSITDSPYIVLRRSRTKGLDGLFIGQVKQILRSGDEGMEVMLADKSGRPWDEINTDPTVGSVTTMPTGSTLLGCFQRGLLQRRIDLLAQLNMKMTSPDLVDTKLRRV